MLKIKQTDISGKNVKINFNLTKGNNYFVSDRENNLFIDESVEKEINSFIDNDLIFFYPQNVTEIIFKLFNSNGIDLNYADLGFTNDDINFLSNRFINSKFRINFFDDLNPSSRSLVHQINLPYQLNEYQRDINGELSDNASEIKVIFQIKKNDFEQFSQVNSVGYNILLPTAQPLFTYPKVIYAEYLFLNALNGQSIRFMPTNNYTQSDYYNKSTLRYLCTISQDKNYYNIINTYGTTTIQNNKMIISLYKISF